jgi:hypothetical protein
MAHTGIGFSQWKSWRRWLQQGLHFCDRLANANNQGSA